MMIDLKEIFVLDVFLEVYFLLKIIDFTTGFLKAWKIEGFKSRKMRDGVIMVIGEVVAIGFASIIDLLIGTPSILVRATKCLFICKEGLSIIENLGVIGVDLPQSVKDRIQELKDDNKGE